MHRASVLIAMALLAGPALADGPGAVTSPLVAAPAPVAPAVPDWSGGYVGLSYGEHSGSDLSFAGPAVPGVGLDDSSDFGLHGGYAWQRGSFVYGAEATFNFLSDQEVTGGPAATLEDILDVSGRIGYAVGPVLLFGLGGYSVGDYAEATDWEVDGTHYGIGGEYLVNNRFSLGLQYVERDMDGSNPDGSGQTVDIDQSTFSLRGSFRF